MLSQDSFEKIYINESIDEGMAHQTILFNDWKIVLNKFFKGFLLSFIIFALGYFIFYLDGMNLPFEYTIYGSLIFAVLEAVLKGLQQYKPEYAEEFQWFYEAIFGALKRLLIKPKIV